MAPLSGVELLKHVAEVPVETPGDIPTVPGDIDIASAWRNGQGIGRQVGLDEATVSLGLQFSQHLGLGQQAEIQPRR